MSQATNSTTAGAVDSSDVGQWLIGRITFYDQVDASDVTLSAPLAELGLDSIYVMTLCGDIEDTYGLSIDPTFFADYQTLGEVADALSALIAKA